MKSAFWPGMVVSVLLLGACAPGPARSADQSKPVVSAAGDLRAAFSDAGVAWVSGGRACVARVPDFVPRCPRIGYAVDVAWPNGTEAWAAVPGLGQVVTLDQSPQSVMAGAVTVLSRQHIYRQDGSALTYAGQPDGGMAGRPAQVVTGGDGVDYALLAGQLLRVSDGTVVDTAPQPYLLATATGVTTAAVPTVQVPGSTLAGSLGSYRLQADRLEHLDAAGKVIAGVALGHSGAALVGLVGNQVVVVSERGELQRFNTALEALP